LSAGVHTEITRKSDAVAKDLHEPLSEGNIHPADAWATLYALDIEIGALLEECLVLISGAAVRASHSFDPNPIATDDWYRIADALVDELVARTPVPGWDSFTVLGGAESFRHISRLIEVRFPRPSIWDVPSVAHELGHYVARMLAEFRDGRMHNLMDDLHADIHGADATSWYWAEELFADAFAAYVLGPAYGLTCVTFGFDPLTANAGTDSHPPPMVRVLVITQTLRLLNNKSVDWLANSLDGLWADLVAASEAEPPAPDAPQVPNSWPNKIVALLVEHLSASGYQSWQEADRLSLDLRTEKVGPRTTISDVVNAAWLIRIRTKSEISIDAAAAKAFDIALSISQGGANASDGTPVAHGNTRPSSGRSQGS
jgi:hypothetical protein